MNTEFQITPRSKVGEVLEHFPELEEKLISLSPSFEKLRNPILRKTIARIASLQQVALVGNIPLERIINELRQAAGQSQLEEISNDMNNGQSVPAWYTGKADESLDAREMLDRGEHPMVEVLQRTHQLEEGKIYELITPFIPMPLIEKVKAQGLEGYTEQISEKEFRTYFYKPLR